MKVRMRLEECKTNQDICVELLNAIFEQNGIDETATPSNTKSEIKELTKEHITFKINYTSLKGLTLNREISLPRFFEFEPVNGIVNPKWNIIKEDEDEDR